MRRAREKERRGSRKGSKQREEKKKKRRRRERGTERAVEAKREKKNARLGEARDVDHVRRRQRHLVLRPAVDEVVVRVVHDEPRPRRGAEVRRALEQRAGKDDACRVARVDEHDELRDLFVLL